MKSDFTLAFNEVLEEKGLPKEIIMKAIESAMVSAYRKAVMASTQQYTEAKIDYETGSVQIFAEKEVVDSVEVEITEVSLEDARKFNPEAALGDMVLVECTPKDFGRVAAQTARQVIQQRIRDAEHDAQFEYYEKQVGEIVSGTVQAIGAVGLTVGLELKAEGIMPRKEMIMGERPRMHDRVRALVAEVVREKNAPKITLSRTHRNFLRRLLENEVPEIYHGIVEIRSISREPGQRAKVAVSATQPGIDPVGACVGIKGTRIQAIVRELHDEKIDVIEYSNDPAVYIMKAISPARVSGVYLNAFGEEGKTATVVVMEDQLSLAIGRDGQNARLAAKLTGWRIDIKSLPEAVSDALMKLQSDTSLSEIAEKEAENIARIEELLQRKNEGRPLTPEEYDELAKFVDRVERRKIAIQTPAVEIIEDSAVQDIRSQIPVDVYDQSILDSGLSEHIAYILQDAGFLKTGELVVQMHRNSDAILKLQGIGPKAISEIEQFTQKLLPQPQPVEELASPQDVLEALPEPAAEALETIAEKLPEEKIEKEPEVAEEEPEGPEPSFAEMFDLKAVTSVKTNEEMETDIDGAQKTGTKKKKAKSVVVEYDPDLDMTIAKKKHKRGDADWDSEEF